MENPFNNLLQTPESNPFNDLGSKNLTGVSFPTSGPTNFARIQSAKADAATSGAAAEKANSFSSIASQTINPINLAKASYKVAETAVTHPIESAKQAALGFSNGVTLGATDYLQRRAFIDAATKNGMDETQATSLADNTLQPSDIGLKSIRGGADFAGMVVPYSALENTLIKGARFAAPEFVANYARASKLLVDVGAFSAAGQINESFVPEDQRNRLQRAVIDTATAGVFNLGGQIYRSVRGTPFKSPFEIAPVVNPNALVPQGIVVSEQTLKEGAEKRIAEIEAKNFRRTGDNEELNFLKNNIDNPDKLYGYNSNPPKFIGPVPDAKTTIAIKTGEPNPTTGEPVGPEIRVATNDIESLQNYIKGSGDINYKISDTLGKDAKGNDIQARHEFNPSTGQHTIYTTDATTASNLAHELGHYFDTKLTQTTEKLSQLLPNFIKNRQKIEDALGAFSVDRLGGNATAKQISNDIAKVANNLQREIDILSSIRRGTLVSSKSERFADAVSEIATKSTSADKAPTLQSLLKFSEKNKINKLFTKTEEKVPVIEKPQITPKQKVDIQKVTETFQAKVKENGGVATPEMRKEFQTEKKTITKETPQQFDRTPTGHKPDTEAIRAEKMTNDAEVETFINTKFLSKMKGTERIGKTNQEILDRSLASKMTEEDFNKILTERFGNLSEDIVKAKRILVDGTTALKEKLAGRDIESLDGIEKAEIMGDYTRLVQTFEVFAGVRTELSNSFRSLGIGVTPGENDIFNEALKIIQKTFGDESNPFKLAQKAAKLQESSVVQKYFQVAIPAMLSGYKTSARNIFGNMSNLILQTTSRLFTKQGRKEFMPMIEAIINGQKEAFNKSVAVFKGDETVLNKYYEPMMPHTKAFDEQGKFAFLNKLEYVGKALNAQDMYFKSLANDAEIAAQRVGNYDFHLGGDIQKSLEEALGNAYANKITFRGAYDETFVQGLAKGIASYKQSNNEYLKWFGNQFAPFIKTIAKVTDSRIDFIPILNFSRTFDSMGATKIYEASAKRIVKEANLFTKVYEKSITKNMTATQARVAAQSEVDRVSEIIIGRLKDQQRGRLVMGMAVLTSMAPLAVSGRITGGGPTSKNDRDTLIASGWRPNSIIMPNGVALPYQNLLTPLASIFSILGNISDANKYNIKDTGGAKTAEAMKGFLKSELDQSFLSGISNLVDGITGYKPFSQVITEMGANAIPVPAMWSQVKDTAFPERYDAKQFNEIIRNKLGMTGDFFGTGLTTPLQPNLDTFGHQKKADLIYGLTPPLLNSNNDDPVLQFMLKENISFGKPNKGNKIQGRQGQERPLTPEEYTQYVQQSGSKIYDALKGKIESGYFNRFDTQKEKKKAMDKVVKDIRDREKSKIQY